RPKSAFDVDRIDELAKAPGSALDETKHEARQVVQLRLLLALGGERVGRDDLAREENVGEALRQVLRETRRQRAVQADHEVRPDHPRRVIDAVEARYFLDRLLDRRRHLEERQVVL